MSFGVNDITGAISGFTGIYVWNAQGRLKVIGGGTPPPPAPVVWGTITGLVTNQTDLITYLSGNYYPLSSNPAGYLTQTAADLLYYPLSSNPAGYITSAALSGYVPITRTLTINGTSYDLSADRSWTIPAGGTVTDVTGTGTVSGITLTGTGTTSVTLTLGGTLTLTSSDITTALGYTPYNATNPAGYITLTSLSAGTGITYNNLTGVITNSAPDQVVSLASGTGISVTGTYPSFTITNTSPDQTVSLSTTGTGLAVTGTYPSFTLENTLPDQTVVLTAGTGISITGTYPSFTIDNTSTGGGGGLLYGLATQSPAGVYTSTIAGVTSLTAGDVFMIKFDTVNDGSSTLNINSLGAINIYKNTDIPLAAGDIKANQTVEVVYDGTNFQAIGLVTDQLLAYVHNAEGAVINKGQVVYAYQASGNKMSVKLAKADTDATSAKTIGLVYDTSIGIGGEGYIIIQGVIEGINTAAFSAGDTLYLSGTTFGGLTATKPYAPIHLVYVGIVERANAGNGQIYVRCQNGYEMDELHDVQAQNPNLKDTLWYDTSDSQWKTGSVPSLSGTFTIGATIDGSGGTITVGQKGYVQVPYACTINSWRIIANASGSIVIDVWKAAAPTIPTVANTITAAAKPTLSAQQTAASSTLTGWTTSVAANDIIGFNVDSATTVSWVILQLLVTKT